MMIVIRTAHDCELKQLASIEIAAGQLFRNTTHDFVADLPPHDEGYYRAMPPLSQVSVAVHNDEIVGFCAYCSIDDTDCYLVELSVVPAYNRQGIGRKLIGTAIEWASVQGLQSLVLTTYDDISFNAPYYQKLGFRKFVPSSNCTLADHLKNEKKRLGENRVAMKLNLVGDTGN